MRTSPTIQDVLGRGGVLSRRLDGYRERKQQLDMADAIADAFQRSAHLMAEAPTGTGKSLAYLVPAVLGPVSQGRKVVIATHTIALQDQLVEKDLPLLAASLPIEFTVAKALGRTNYLGLRRLGLALADAPTLVADDPRTAALTRIRHWSELIDEGRRQQLDPPASSEIWDLVQSESDNCLGPRCGTYKDCFYWGARRRLETADIIVTNHALYCTDIMLRRLDSGLLPEHDVLIIDEAHHFERVASDHFGLEISRRGMRWFLRRLTGGRMSPGLIGRLGGEGVEGVRTLLLRLAVTSDGFFDSIDVWFAAQPGGNGRYRQPYIVEDTLSPPLAELADRLEGLADEQEKPEVAVEVSAFGQRALGMATMVRSLLAVDDPDMVYFVERDPTRRATRVAARPLDVAPTLETELFDRVQSVIVTSATLASGRDPKDLGYTAGRLGCTGSDHLVLDSPFDLPRLVEVHVPEDVPLPDEADHDAKAADATLRYIRRAQGGAFLLFTSYRALEASWRRLAAPLGEMGLLVLRQGDAMDRAAMLRRFREDGNAVLFGTDSFWHGVDVPGPALRLVVVGRLPFPVPTTPLNEARAEQLRREGDDPFTSFALPEAVIRWRQGFGRLVRTEDDEGVIVCLDRRILLRPYGARFREAVGAVPWRVGSSEAANEGRADAASP